MRYMDDDERDVIRRQNKETFGAYLKRKRLKDGVTQEELAQQLEVGRTEISHYENGTREMPFSSFFILGECLGFNMTDYVLDTSSSRIMDLYEKAIYREIGKDKGFTIGYVSQMKKTSSFNKQKETIIQALMLYFDSDVSIEAKQLLVIADMLYQKIENKSAMNDVYYAIVQQVAQTGDRRLDKFFEEYIRIIRNER